MRTLLALSACCLLLGTASAKDAPASVAKGAGAASASAASVPASSPVTLPTIKKPVRKLTPKQQEEQAEAELSAKIAERLAEMRANQAARIAAAAKAKKDREAKARLVVATTPPPRANGTYWTYEGEFGPANWSKINSDWGKCSAGTRQSPIDIRDGIKVELEQIAFDYRPSAFNVTDNGHTVQVQVGAGNYLSVAGRMFELQNVHFHRPAEERVNGRSYEMGVHMVHKDVEGKIAVLALMLERGRPQPAVQTIWNNLPLEKRDTFTPSIVLDPNDLLPERRDYFTYMGSLSEPPCTEGVLYLVMKETVQASPAQLALFSRLYPLNARPVQSAAGRMIKESQ
jgi:carbonic anhydrase